MNEILDKKRMQKEKGVQFELKFEVHGVSITYESRESVEKNSHH